MLLDVREVSRAFGGLRALDRVSLRVSEGEAVGLIGPNGAGKTTLLNAIAGMVPPSSGAVHFAAEDVTRLPCEARCRRGISRTFQIPLAFASLTAVESVAVAARFGGRRRNADARSEAARWLEFVGFSLAPATPAGRCNSGELRRLDLARALASRPRLLLLDELFAGLNASEVAELARVLRAVRSLGIALVVVEHLVRLILEECTRVAVLASGIKIADGAPVEVARDPRVVEAYLGADHA